MKLIFDIGYNYGEFSQKCFQKHPGCKIIGVEANSSLVYGMRNTENFHIINAAASDKDDSEIDFYIEPNQSGISTASKEFISNSRFTKGSKNLKPNSSKWMPPIKMNTITIDKMINDYGNPDFIKVDVEGYEHTVLKGLSKKSGQICFEWHEESASEVYKIAEHLQSIGYDKFGIIGYFDEGDVHENFTYSETGDPYLEYPKEYFSWEKLGFSNLVKDSRRINYGMMYVK